MRFIFLALALAGCAHTSPIPGEKPIGERLQSERAREAGERLQDEFNRINGES